MNGTIRNTVLAVVVGLIMLLVIPAGVLTWFSVRPVAPPQPVLVEVATGRTFASVAQELAQAEVVADARALRLLARLKQADRGIHAGVYQFSGAQTPLEVLEILRSGRVEMVHITVPEGLRLHEVIARCVAAGLGSVERYTHLLEDEKFIASLALESVGLQVGTLEGYLFPETYHFAPGTSEAVVLRTMVGQMLAHLKPELVEAGAKRNLTPHELLTLASIIQKEAGNEEEMARISAVFHNRMQRNMRLQSDPTVIYAQEDFDGNLTRAHLQQYHPYNTYTILGLPPGPIASPGAAALYAAAFPADDDALYFVATREGGHYFSRTLREHNNAVRRYQLRK
ncbi:MAG: endolytic transglycosylase MltG [Desulfuromonadaceae bacterium]|nr:endolytic transglycosylase MltG [Desulfuromonadaceae bacterium]